METGNTMLQAFLSLSKKHGIKVHRKETGLKVVDEIHLIFIGMSESMTLLPKCTSC
jgi:hypothetical protein